MSTKIEKGSIVLDLTGQRTLGIVLEMQAGEVLRGMRRPRQPKGPVLAATEPQATVLVGIQKDGTPVTESRKLRELSADLVAVTNKPMLDNCDFGDRQAPAGALATLSHDYSGERAPKFGDGYGPFTLVVRPSGVCWHGQTFEDLDEDLVLFPSREAALFCGHKLPTADALELGDKVRDLFYDHALLNEAGVDGALVPRAVLAELGEFAHQVGNADVAVTARLLSTQDLSAGGDADRALCSIEALDWMAINSGIGERFGEQPEAAGFVAVPSQAQLDSMDADNDTFEP